jgi:hypothetical protein
MSLPWYSRLGRSPITGAVVAVVFMLLEAFWLLGLPIGIDSSLHWQYGLGGLVCIFAALVQAAWAVREKESALEARIASLESQPRPRLQLREPGAIHMDEIPFFHPGMQQPVLVAEFIHVRFVNEPLRPEPSAVAKSIAAKVSFSREGRVLKTIDGRWSDVDQPTPLKSVLPLLRATFDIGDEHNVDIVFKVLGDNDCYMFNNDNYKHLDLKPADHALQPGKYEVTVRLVGVYVDQPFTFLFTNPGAGRPLVLHV